MKMLQKDRMAEVAGLLGCGQCSCYQGNTGQSQAVVYGRQQAGWVSKFSWLLASKEEEVVEIEESTCLAQAGRQTGWQPNRGGNNDLSKLSAILPGCVII